jgi:hypothetical protein
MHHPPCFDRVWGCGGFKFLPGINGAGGGYSPPPTPEVAWVAYSGPERITYVCYAEKDDDHVG